VKRRRLLVVLACAAVLIAGVTAVSYLCRPPALYRTTILPSLGGTMTAAHAINEQGQVVGIAQTKDGQWRLFLWDRRRGMQDLGVTGAARFDINNAGQIAGAVADPNGNRTAHLWEPAKGWTSLGTLGGKSSYAWAINNHGGIVGSSETSDRHLHAFLWDRTHGMRDLGTLGGTESQGRAINDASEVFGLSHTPTEEYRPFLWDPNSGMAAIGPLPPGTSLNGLNNGSWTVGPADDQPLRRRMIAWNRNAGLHDLFPLDRPIIDLPLLNDAGQVVYWEMPADSSSWIRRRLFPSSPRYYLWDPNRGEVLLDSYIPAGAKEVFLPIGMNNHGCIVGVVESRSEPPRARAILLEPIPERWGR
jgi:probable HAF family extracellular repeat protein